MAGSGPGRTLVVSSTHPVGGPPAQGLATPVCSEPSDLGRGLRWVGNARGQPIAWGGGQGDGQ